LARLVGKWVLGCLLGGVQLSCAGGAHQRLVGYPLPPHQPLAIVIEISDQVNAADDGGGVATLADTVSDELKKNGIMSQLYFAKDHPPPPRVELNVRYWHGTPRISHQLAAAGMLVRPVGLGALLTAGNQMIVDCRVILPGSPEPAFKRRFDTSAFGVGWTENDDNSSATKAGAQIVDAIMTR